MLKVIGWVDYDDTTFETAKGTDAEFNAVAKNIKENGYKFGGDDHEEKPFCCPVLSNGKALRLSWRSWGYVMALAYDLKTKDGDYNYILWYMGEYGPEKRVFPKKEEVDYGAIKGYKVHTYRVSDDELKSINNAFLTYLVFPSKYLEENPIHVKDKMILKYKDKVLLKAVVEPAKFRHISIKELFVKDDYFYYAESTNFMFLNELIVKKVIKQKYKMFDDELVILEIKIEKDYREDINYD